MLRRSGSCLTRTGRAGSGCIVCIGGDRPRGSGVKDCNENQLELFDIDAPAVGTAEAGHFICAVPRPDVGCRDIHDHQSPRRHESVWPRLCFMSGWQLGGSTKARVSDIERIHRQCLDLEQTRAGCESVGLCSVRGCHQQSAGHDAPAPERELDVLDGQDGAQHGFDVVQLVLDMSPASLRNRIVARFYIEFALERRCARKVQLVDAEDVYSRRTYDFCCS